jgi:hypothetical protein
MKNAFFYLAILGWLVSIAIHVLAIFDQIGDSDAIFLKGKERRSGDQTNPAISVS